MIPVLPSLYRKSVGACNISDPTGSDLIFHVDHLYIVYCLYHTVCSYEYFYVNIQLVAPIRNNHDGWFYAPVKICSFEAVFLTGCDYPIDGQ